jgi:alpha-tubulin suppressor-like RCC1 family protein
VKRTILLAAALAACTSQPDPPAQVEPAAHAMSVGDLRTIAVVDPTGEVNTTGTDVPLPVDSSSGKPIALDLPPVTQVAAGAEHACALSGPQVYCWGDDTNGALGAHRECTPPMTQGDTPDCKLPPAAMPTLPAIRSLAAGNDVTCAIGTDDLVYCWGDGSSGALGGSLVPALDPPTPVALPDGTQLHAARLQIHETTVCAVDRKQSAWCWGTGYGQAPVRQDLTGVLDIAASHTHACAATMAGVTCWGSDRNGESGDLAFARSCPESSDCTVGPTAIALDATEVTVGERHSCALVQGSVMCWGSNEVGQLGRTDAFLVGDVGTALDGVVDLGSGFAKVCALRSDKTVWCWGEYRTY